MSDTLQTTKLPLPAACYVDKEYLKKWVILHHTASDGNPFGVASWWKQQANHVSCPYIISRGVGKNWKDGELFECFPETKGCWTLGLTQSHFNDLKGNKHTTSTALNMNALTVELCNWGSLIKKNDKYLTYSGEVVPELEVYDFEDTLFRGSRYYHKYSEAQLDTTRTLLLYWKSKYDIDIKFQGMEMFEYPFMKGFAGVNGVYTHVGYRRQNEKQDLSPQKPLLQMLQSL